MLRFVHTLRVHAPAELLNNLIVNAYMGTTIINQIANTMYVIKLYHVRKSF